MVKLEAPSNITFENVTINKDVLKFFTDYLEQHKSLNTTERRVYTSYLEHLANPVFISNTPVEMYK